MSEHDPTRSDNADGGQPASAEQQPRSASDAPRDQLAELEQQLQEAQERVLRAQAETENVRRRMRREIEEERRYASQPLLADLLPAWDNLQRAIESAEQTDPDSGLLQGVRMVSQQLADILSKHHCPKIEADGQEFDPRHHEAIGHQPSGDVPAGRVLLVAQEGFRLHDRIVRPAQVIVSSGPHQDGAGSQES